MAVISHGNRMGWKRVVDPAGFLLHFFTSNMKKGSSQKKTNSVNAFVFFNSGPTLYNAYRMEERWPIVWYVNRLKGWIFTSLFQLQLLAYHSSSSNIKLKYIATNPSSSLEPCQLSMIGYSCASVMEKSRTRKFGERIAHCTKHKTPRDDNNTESFLLK